MMSIFSSDVPVAGPYAPSCASRTADGALRGVVYAGDAEMGARGAGQKTRVGDFVATR